MNNLLKQEKVPYFLAILFAIVAYTLTHIVDRLSLQPIVRYSVDRDFSKKECRLTYHVKNITTDKTFDSVDFLIIPTNDDSINAGDVNVFPPMKLNSTADFTGIKSNVFAFHLGNFQPNSKFDIYLEKKKGSEPDIRIFSKSTVVLQKASFETFLIENEILILISVMVVCISIIIWYIFKLK